MSFAANRCDIAWRTVKKQKASPWERGHFDRTCRIAKMQGGISLGGFNQVMKHGSNEPHFGAARPSDASHEVAQGPGPNDAQPDPLSAIGPRPRMPLCAAVEVTKRFGGVTAVDAVSFEVLGGETHALVGENGAGKSSLMNVLHGLYRPDQGHVEVDGRRAELRSTRDAEALGIAMIPQELELFVDLSVAENLFVGRRRPRGRSGLYHEGSINEAAREVFASLGVSVDVRAPIRYASFAVRQLTAIGRALLGKARVVIMDEPTAALTDREADRLFAAISRLEAEGTGIVYVSHRLKEVEQIASRVTVMRDGRRIATCRRAEMSTDEMVRLMVGRPLSRLFSRHHTPSHIKVLEVRGLTRTGEFADISFSVCKGEVVGLAGLIGAGRTEVAQAIFGLRPLDRGEIRVQGEALRIASPGRALEKGIAYVPEERRAQGLFLPLSIERNISMTVLPRISPRGLVDRVRERRMVDELSRLLDIRGARTTAPVLRLSGGNQQKVVLAKALALQPQVLILDEPTRGVDIGAKAEIYRLIDELAHQGKAVLLISSELEEVLAMSDRILVMCEGRLVASFGHLEVTPHKVAAAAAGLAEPSSNAVGVGGSS
jgi:rhamnose transport system ATP-binding protein